MNSKAAFLSGLFLRYVLIIIAGFLGIELLYTVFTPVVVYPTFLILKLFYSGITLEGSKFLLNGYTISIISACISGSAYYLILILNLATPMPVRTRTKSLIFTLLSFSVLNIIRLSIFSVLFFTGYEYFDIAHKAVWYFGSTVLVVALWFLNVYIFKIKSIPAYTDFKSLSGNVIKRRKKL